ncbi:MAG: spermidine/putrescine ABC transporter substrate-binding protein [Acidaminococcaceae bacterium]|nr:spermidine/putrescine ABC transporter substrate-binding protein [Acidaminococcaceae bacterium]
MKKIVSLALSLLLGSTLLLAGCGGSSGGKANTQPQTLNLFSWADNFDPEVLAEFEKKYNCKINYDVFANNEELLAKIQAGGARYDIIQPSDYMVGTMIKLDLLEKLNKKNIPNLTNLNTSLQAPAYDPTGDYSSIYTWGVTGIAYNKKYVKVAPTSWEDLWNEEYKGRVILLNDNREIIGMALKKDGFSNNATDPRQLAKAVDDLKELAPLVMAYDTDTIKQKFIAEEAWIGTMWSGDASFAYKDNKNIGFVVPKEGTTIWADTFAIPRGTKNKELAEKFINFMYEPKVSAKNYEYIGYNDPNEKAKQYHSEAFNNDPMLKIGAAHIDKGEWLIDIGEAITAYDKAWTELKTIK